MHRMFTHVSIMEFFALFMLSSLLFALCEARNFYDDLGVKKSATDREIKRAFHKLAMKYHPDKNKDPGAEKKFQEIAEAYEVLSNPEKRRQFDQFGDAAFQNNEFGSRSNFHFNFDDIFKDFGENFGHSFHGERNFGSKSNSIWDDFFNDEDDDPFQTFDQFGSGNSFFGNQFMESQSHHSRESFSSGRSCKTVTQRNGNMVTTYTKCS